MKPMLSYTIDDTSKIEYPVFVSHKLDGIRALVIDGVVYSRSMKPIRSKVVQELFGKAEYNGLDGELLYGDWNASDVFNKTTQAVMSTDLKDGFEKEEIRYAVFDFTEVSDPYQIRLDIIQQFEINNQPEQVEVLKQIRVDNEAELLDFETVSLDAGYEGIMVRSIDGVYKQGRSTQREGTIGKLKRFSDDDAVVIGFEEKMTNTNEKVTNELGRCQRSQAQDGMVGAGTLGALICECNGIRFTMGSGFDDAGRDEVWNNKEKYIGKLAKFKYFAIGMVNSYRFPIFISFRDSDDISK
jgi:DNA ligase-1